MQNQIRKKLTLVVCCYFKRPGRAIYGIESAVCKASFKCSSTLGHQGKSYRTSHLQRHKDKYLMLKVHDSCQIFSQRR